MHAGAGETCVTILNPNYCPVVLVSRVQNQVAAISSRFASGYLPYRLEESIFLLSWLITMYTIMIIENKTFLQIYRTPLERILHGYQAWRAMEV